MDVDKFLAELRRYKRELDRAIAAFDRLARKRGEGNDGGKSGRPPKATRGVKRKRGRRKPTGSF